LNAGSTCDEIANRFEKDHAMLSPSLTNRSLIPLLALPRKQIPGRPEMIHAKIAIAALVLLSLHQSNLAAAVIENFDNPIGIDGRVLFRASTFYDGITASEPPDVSGGDNDGNASLNGLITQAAFTISSDQSGSGFYLHTQTAGNAPAGVQELWGTIAPISIVTPPNTVYEFSFYLANDNTVGPPLIQPFINGAPLGAAVSPTGINTWQRFTFTWNSGAVPPATADLSLRNNNTSGSGNDFGTDMIAFGVIPEPGSFGLCVAPIALLARRRRRKG
jgi:hypothetical protein